MTTDNLAAIVAFFLNPWIIIGFFGQFLFFMRFIVQWWASEKAGRVVVPKMFWYLSIGGTLVILVYSIYRVDPVFIIAQILSLFIYGRNLMFERKLAAQSATVKSDTNLPE